MKKSKIKITAMIGASLLTAVLATGCADYERGGARSVEDAAYLAKKLRLECKPNGVGIENVHSWFFQKVEIFKCEDGTIGFIPSGFGL